jgi:tetratricopeptide (TPR) repeat protein/DNA-binding transcriptional ArsR family regulator
MPSARLHFSRRAAEALLAAALNAVRRGLPLELPARHVLLRATLDEKWFPPIAGTLGDQPSALRRDAESGRLLLVWIVAQLRPDRLPGLDGIDEHAWLHSTSWRPLLTIACHHGLLAIPAFPARYRRRPDEAPLENLCGLWSVGHSTVYRYIEKARRQLVDLAACGAPDGSQRVGLRRVVDEDMRKGAEPPEGWLAWHASQGRAAILRGSVCDALWHFGRAGDVEAALDTARRLGGEAAGSSETDALLAELENTRALSEEQRIELALCWAGIWHFRHDGERAGEALNRALRLADVHGEPLYLGITHAALGRHYEERDRDRAIACCEESLRWLRRSIEESGEAVRLRAVNEYADCAVHLAWLHLRRNNPKAKTLLEQVPTMSGNLTLPDGTVGALEQAWGEYWRCVGNPGRALEHKHRALTIYQRLGDQRSILNTYRNLSLIYSDAKEFDRAIKYGELVLSSTGSQAVEPEVLAGAHGNVGIAYFFKGDLDRAIEHYRQALGLQAHSGLRAQLIAIHYNLAEAHYERFKRDGKAADESLGDSYAATAARLSAEDNAHAQADAARSLKREVLGTGEGPDRLLPAEHAAHFTEMAEIERLRLALAVPQPIEQQVRTHLAIARAYLGIATKEREMALALAKRHGVTADFSADLESLRTTYERELTREQRLAATWQRRVSPFLAPEQCRAALGRVLAAGFISKSAYAEACGVSPATASKHLASLVELGLLHQTGRGPSTRYLLTGESGD